MGFLPPATFSAQGNEVSCLCCGCIRAIGVCFMCASSEFMQVQRGKMGEKTICCFVVAHHCLLSLSLSLSGACTTSAALQAANTQPNPENSFFCQHFCLNWLQIFVHATVFHSFMNQASCLSNPAENQVETNQSVSHRVF